MSDPSWYSILPPLLAIILAISTKQVVLSLFAGIWMGFTIMSGFNPLAGVTASLDGIINVFTDPGDTRVLLFTLIIGSLIATIEHSGGVRGFVHFLETRRWVHNGLRAQILAWATGLFIFIESNITLLVAGSVARPLFDRYHVSREKLAYLIDATSAPVCVMIPLNAWGAVIVGLIASTGVENLRDRRDHSVSSGHLEEPGHRTHEKGRRTDTKWRRALAWCNTNGRCLGRTDRGCGRRNSVRRIDGDTYRNDGPDDAGRFVYNRRWQDHRRVRFSIDIVVG